MLLTLDEILTDVNPLQPEKAPSPMLVTFEEIATEVNPLQPENARSPMLVTLNGIVTSPFTPAMSIEPSLVQSKPSREL